MKTSDNEWESIKAAKITSWPFKGRSINDLNLLHKLLSVKKYLQKNHLALIALLIGIVFPILSILFEIRKDITADHTYLPPRSISPANAVPVVKCSKPSLISVRLDTVKCSIDGTFSNVSILDPCFQTSDKYKDYVVCTSDPYDEKQVFEYSLIESDIDYENIFSNRSSEPWFLKLSSGEMCKLGYGGTRAIADSNIAYICSGGQIEGLVPPIDDTGDLWKIRCLGKDSNTLEYCIIKESWK